MIVKRTPPPRIPVLREVILRVAPNSAERDAWIDRDADALYRAAVDAGLFVTMMREFDVATLSALTGLSIKTFANMRSDGTGPAYSKGGGRRHGVRYAARDVAAWRWANRRSR